MSNLTVQTWERDFRKAAKADSYDIFRDHMSFLELPVKPITMMKATILMVQAMTAYYAIDGRLPQDFLAMQPYNPAKSTGAPYVLTFDLCGHAYGRLLVDPELHSIDLADLYNHPWQPYRVSCYSNLRISHIDRSDITKAEAKFLEDQVTDDQRFDYSEDELGFWFDDSNPKCLHVDVHDLEEFDDEEEEEE
jgi:hypothetical protein